MKNSIQTLYASLLALLFSLLPTSVWADKIDLGATEQQATNWVAIGMFVVFVGFTLGITKWAASKTRSTADM